MAFDSITYNSLSDQFEFKCNMFKFPKTDASFKKDWIICTNGTRIRTFRNPEKNGEFDNEEVDLTAELKKLFDNVKIDYSNGDIREDICRIDSKDFFVTLLGIMRLTLQMRNSITGNVDVDYLISPVKDCNGVFYDSRICNASLPQNADANGAYNIARKVLWAINQFKAADATKIGKVSIAISNAQWLEYAQKDR